MKIFIVKAVLVAAIVSGVSAEAFSAASRVSSSVSRSQPALQAGLFGSFDLFKSVLDYLIAPAIELKPVDEGNDECHPKAVRNKETWIKCGYKY
ncbi:MAG: hypothetical protein IPM63_18245 [Acidobacteriota bacterium]|nr:MAG: hypothetical protein IPM63_18245 [Acidobacteriota bacterium]